MSGNLTKNYLPTYQVFLECFSIILLFKITHSAHLGKLLLIGIHVLDHLIFNCIELLASFKSCKEALIENVLVWWRTFPLTYLHTLIHLCAHYTWNIADGSLYTVQFKLYTTHCKVYITHFKLYTARCTQHHVQLYMEPCRGSVECVIYSDVQCTVTCILQSCSAVH